MTSPEPAMSLTPSGSPTTGALMTDTAAADLRTKLDLALGEHIIFAAKATEAALGGRTAEFAAYGDLLNKNGTDLGAMIGAAWTFGSTERTSLSRAASRWRSPTTARQSMTS
jgi:uncharacterized metal-binding protein